MCFAVCPLFRQTPELLVPEEIRRYQLQLAHEKTLRALQPDRLRFDLTKHRLSFHRNGAGWTYVDTSYCNNPSSAVQSSFFIN